MTKQASPLLPVYVLNREKRPYPVGYLPEESSWSAEYTVSPARTGKEELEKQIGSYGLLPPQVRFIPGVIGPPLRRCFFIQQSDFDRARQLPLWVTHLPYSEPDAS